MGGRIAQNQRRTLHSWPGEERSRADREDVTPSGSVTAAQYIIPLRDARSNCLNLKGVMAIKLVAAPRYQLYIYLLLLDKFFVAQDERAFEASICGVRSQDTVPSANTSRNASRDIATFSRLVKTFSLRATADLYSRRNSEREMPTSARRRLLWVSPRNQCSFRHSSRNRPRAAPTLG